MALTLNGDGRISGANLNIDSDGAATFAGLTVDTNTLYVDAANTRVGIGTTSPDALLRVTGTSGSPQLAVGAGSNAIFVNSFDNNPIYMTASTTNSTGFGIGSASNIPTFFMTNNTERMRIDTAGRVTMPYQPAFTAWNVGDFTLTGSFTLNTIILNTGGHYSTSTGRFTAPVTGMYFFSLAGFSETTAEIMGDVELRRNGAMVVRTYSSEPGGTYRPFATQCIIFLSAGDFVQPHSSSALHGNNNPVFSGHLIG
jgi:hypothetical protein